MEYRINNSRIVDKDIENKITAAVDFDSIDKNRQYDMEIEFYNSDLVDYSLNEDVSYEIKKEHIKLVRTVRSIFEKNGIKINKLCLMGTIVNMYKDEISIFCKKSKYTDLKENTIWPCKEIFIYEDGKTALDLLLFTNQISDEEYKMNLESLQEELSIFESDEEFRYIN